VAVPVRLLVVRQCFSAAASGDCFAASAFGFAASLAAFFEREACGQCPPCVVGTQNLAKGIRTLAAGRARRADLGSLGEVAAFMSQHGYCAHSRTAAASVTGLLSRFQADVLAHVTGGPRHGRHADPFGAHSRERAAIEATLPS
jgi:hypothetical protein